MVGATAACSVPAPAPTPPAGTLPGGTAEVTVGSRGTGTERAVACRIDGSVTTITIGTADAKATAVIDNTHGLAAKSVSIRNINGFTGSYWQDLQGSADVHMVGQTYRIDGVANGYEVDGSHTPVTRTFSIRVAC